MMSLTINWVFSKLFWYFKLKICLMLNKSMPDLYQRLLAHNKYVYQPKTLRYYQVSRDVQGTCLFICPTTKKASSRISHIKKGQQQNLPHLKSPVAESPTLKKSSSHFYIHVSACTHDCLCTWVLISHARENFNFNLGICY